MVWREQPTAVASCCCVISPCAKRSSLIRLRTLTLSKSFTQPISEKYACGLADETNHHDRTKHQVEVDHRHGAFSMKMLSQCDQPDRKTDQYKSNLIGPGLCQDLSIALIKSRRALQRQAMRFVAAGSGVRPPSRSAPHHPGGVARARS